MTDELMEAAKWAATRVHQLRADNERLEAENTRLLDAKGRMRVELAQAQTENARLTAQRDALVKLLPPELAWKEDGAGLIRIDVDKTDLRAARRALEQKP